MSAGEERLTPEELRRVRKNHGVVVPLDDVRLLLDVGGSAELRRRMRELARVVGWCQDRPQLGRDIWEGMARALEDLQELRERVEAAEDRLREWGWELLPGTGRILEVKLPGEDGTLPRGRRRELVSAWAADVFRVMRLEEGWSQGNTQQAREEVRSRMVPVFPARFLGTGKGFSIHSALSSALHRDP